MAEVNIFIDDELKEKGDHLFRERTIPFRVHVPQKNITLASENALAKEWLAPEEDLAWADL